MSSRKYVVTLTPKQRQGLKKLVKTGREAAQTLSHARVLLQSDGGEQGPGWIDAQIIEALEVSHATVTRVKRRFALEGLEAALSRRPSSRPRPRKLGGTEEARLVQLACSQAPPGHKGWTLRLLADRMVELEVVESISHETVRQTLKKTSLNPGW